MSLLHLENIHDPWEDTLSYQVADQIFFETWQLILVEL